MGLELLPDDIHERYQIDERRHACAILRVDFPEQFDELVACLRQFELLRSEIVAGGGGKTRIANRFDDYLKADPRAWHEKQLTVKREVGDRVVESATHKVDLCKGRIALEVEWNNKDPFFSRDLGTFRLFHELDEISVGIILTRADKLQEVFDSLGYVQDKHGRWQQVGRKYGASTTHWGKLIPRVNSGEGGVCPLLLIGIKRSCYRDDIPHVPVVDQPPS